MRSTSKSSNAVILPGLEGGAFLLLTKEMSQSSFVPIAKRLVRPEHASTIKAYANALTQAIASRP